MPLYEYQCDACGHRFERIQKFSDPLVTACPECDGSVRKLVSSPAIQFKGTGWYITDYARKDAAGAGGSSGKETSEKQEKKTESSSSSSDSSSTSQSSSSGSSSSSSSSGGSSTSSGSTPSK